MAKLSHHYIREILQTRCNVVSEDRLLVAVSGGADSMALLHLLHATGRELEVAHCNFLLRDSESDGDMQLVKDYCAQLDITLHVKRFETEAYAEENKVSIEMAARDLRYEWFNDLLEQQGLNAIVTGHHGHDSIETFFLNLVRGAGVKGLSGMSFRNDNIIRPLLECSSDEVQEYCKVKQIPYREDSSNSDTKFLRNKIRHEVIPVLESINPSFFKTMLNNMSHIKEAEQLLENEVDRFRNEILVEEHGKVLIPISKLELFPQKQSILFEVLRPYGFNTTVVDDLVAHLDGISGKQFFSETHRLIKDRHNLLVVKRENIDVDHFWLDEGETQSPLSIGVKLYDIPEDFKFSKDNNLVQLDADTIELPLLVRKWKQGDSFMPLGMSKFKKVSDFFIDNKFSLLEKEEAWLIVSGEDIIWIAGHRIDDRVKTTKRTKRILELKLANV